LIKNGRTSEAWNILKDVQKDAAGTPLIEMINVEYMSALLSFEDNKYDQALQIFRKINNELPEVAEPKYFYAITLLKTGNISEAIQEFQRLSMWPNTSDNYFLGSVPGAQFDWPVPAVKSLYWLGIAYANQGNKEKSTAEFKKFLEIWKSADFNSAEINDAKMQLKKLE
jgi:tetratricopeptide (TPR) repeat protein